MSHSRVVPVVVGCALACACLVTPAAAAMRLVPVPSAGLSSPLYVTHAGDNSARLFIVERGGLVKVLQPGGTTPSVFLDIRSRLVSGGEQGLLGLAFHPLYAANGRFFVFYTRSGDGALTIAEYGVSANPDVASSAEIPVLTIPHPGATNHNGGMIAFGSDGYLYIGVGDGGGANDPSNNAQNIDLLLGKILRIDINPPAGSGVPYLSPSTNPFYGSIPGRDEIYVVGMRNPWRFSFDRVTGEPWVGDVGQGAKEEVDTPLVPGGNYGWRVYEGLGCTGLDPGLCNPSNYVMPLFEYGHSNGRCSLTGGYVYRGSQNVVPQGTYIYADYCSGEIFAWDGTTQTVLIDTTMKISSFGEDEQGELYVVDLDGTVNLLGPIAPCSFRLSTHDQAFGAAGGTAAVVVTTALGCDWTATTDEPWIHVTAGGAGSGPGTVSFTVDANPSMSSRLGLMTIADGGQRFAVDQSGAGAACVYTVTVTPAPAAGRVAVSAPAGCQWTAQSETPGVAVVRGSRGVGDGVVTYRVTRPRGRARGRAETLTVAGQRVTVTPR